MMMLQKLKKKRFNFSTLNRILCLMLKEIVELKTDFFLQMNQLLQRLKYDFCWNMFNALKHYAAVFLNTAGYTSIRARDTSTKISKLWLFMSAAI